MIESRCLGENRTPLLNIVKFIGNSDYRQEVKKRRKCKKFIDRIMLFCLYFDKIVIRTIEEPMSTLEIKDLYIRVEEKEILKGVNLTINTTRFAPSWDQMEQGNQHFLLLRLWVTLILKSHKAKFCLTVLMY